ncbi:TonB-dependent receptor, plug [Candidatus Sulfopaludibacter sp. SbA3]|nr:TonB-dependent receptor, plug [Candidatus Sulfopaludibacter sp. SbA3]
MVEKIAAETPANITVVNSITLSATPGTDLDDRLRDIPGFTLFRRASSMVANPTTQGVSLRGIGSSGTSRTLVLWDGIPANDPFGGWVYWTQFIPDEMDRVEVSRGAATSVFGNMAMSGAVANFSRQPEPFHLRADYEAGNENTHDFSLGFSNLWKGWAISGDTRAFYTDGYYIVPASIRGPVDRRAGVKFITGDIHLDGYTRYGNLFFKTNILVEDRQNGTSLTRNSTSLGTASMHYVEQFASESLSVTVFRTQEGFHASFSSIPANRQTEKLTYLQSVPSQATGGAAIWQHHNVKWDLTGGVDADRINGTDTDHLFPSGSRVGGGTQFFKGVFGQFNASVGGLHLYTGVRESFTGMSGNFFSPNAGLAYGKKQWRLRGSLYRAFRAPTLNELYRNFSTGNTFTEANPALKPETVFGSEVGVDWIGENSSVRLTGYRNSLGDLVTNVTLSSSATSIVRQRANAAAAISRGMEAEFRRRYHDLTGTLSYLYADSRYDTGPRIAQVPKHQGTAQLNYQHAGTLLSLGVRSFDYQFDDDLNQFRLPGYATVQLLARQRLVLHGIHTHAEHRRAAPVSRRSPLGRPGPLA